MLYRMTRRDLLKVTAAGSALTALGGWRTVRFASAQGSAEYELIDLGASEVEVTAPLNSFAQGGTRVNHLSAEGVCCGSIGVSPERRSPATWSASGKMKRLESGKNGAFANRINTAGDVTGYEYVSERAVRPVAWLDGERTLLAMPDDGFDYEGLANDIADDGVIVGILTQVSGTSILGSRGVRWVDGELELLEAPDGARPNSILRINEQGTMLASFDGVYALWNGDEMTPIPLPDTDLRLFAFDLNDNDQVLAFLSTSDQRTAGYMASGDELTELASLDDEELSRIGRGIDNDGTIVGETWDHRDENAPHRATRWIDNEPIDLNTLIPDDTGLTLTSATAINDDGLICGLALDDDGVTHGFVLKPA